MNALNAEPYLRPQAFIIRLVRGEYQPAIEALLDEKCGAANGNIFVFVLPQSRGNQPWYARPKPPRRDQTAAAR